jgi:hypothetical protein
MSGALRGIPLLPGGFENLPPETAQIPLIGWQ